MRLTVCDRLKVAIPALAVLLFPWTGVQADVWKWVDAFGETRYVDTARPIFTWVEEERVYFSDTPDHEDAIAVQLVWHSRGNLADLGDDPEAEGDGSTESPEDRAARLEAQREYCQRVTEIHDSYVNAPRMYRTNDKGDREYLSDREVRKAIREIAAAKKDACK